VQQNIHKVSITVENITKYYGQQKALNQVSFEVDKGQIVGFLGPNGAGKSTMMKILTGYTPQSEGLAKVCGFDVNEQSMEVRKRVGYLAEHNPLYLDMYVKEYLTFVGNLHHVPNVNQAVKNIIEKTGLGVEQHKKLGQLSKGYRQRVGLSQALIHNPEVLIMDEPTTGLDPNQLEEIRKLIKEIGKEKTVMLSTHIMQEVEAICDRVIIINKGEIVANEQIAFLQSNHFGKSIYIVEFDKTITRNQLKQLAEVHDAKNISGHVWHIESKGQADIRKIVFDFAVQQQLVILAISKEEQSLEDVFKQLTKKIAT
jgi:ABC-2 type transport system ATP-binding protein